MNTKHTTAVFWCGSILYCLAWASLAGIFQSNFRADVIEEYFLGGQWTFASGKHPMICSWYLNLFRIVTFESPIAPYLAVQSLVLVMLWSIWRLANLFFKDDPEAGALALAIVAASVNFRYLNIGNLIFNHNTAVSVCWTLAILFLYRALTENRLSLWIWTGFWLGLGFQCKYVIVMLVLAILIFMFANRRARQYWKTPGPYLTTAVAFLIFLPHLLWLVQHDFPTLRYAFPETGHAVTWYQRILNPLEFLGSLLLLTVPAAITLIPVIGWIWQWKRTPETVSEPLEVGAERRFQTSYLGAVIGIPVALYMLAGALGRNQPASYVMPCGIYCTLFLIVLLARKTDPASLKRAIQLGVVIAVTTMIVWCSAVCWNSRYGKKPGTVDFPGRRLAAEVEGIWSERFADVPCPYVTGLETYWLPGNVYAYGKRKIRVHHLGVTLDSTDEDVNRFGGVVLWNPDREPDGFDEARRRFSRAESLPDLVIPYEKPFSSKFPPTRIGVAIIPPGTDGSH